MGAQAATTSTRSAETVPVAKADLIAAWSIRERLVVSLRKIGSHHATASAQSPMTPDQRGSFRQALEEFFGGEFLHDAARARTAVDPYPSEDEGEAISIALKYWQPK